MWSRSAIRSAGRAVAAAAVLLAAAGCGFQPMYAERGQAGSGQISPGVLNSVAIPALPDRVGQQLHNALRDRLNPRGQPTDPRYRLRVSVSSTEEPSTLRSDGTANRKSFNLGTNWQLESYDSGRQLFGSSANATTSYNVVDQPYATVTAFRDAQERVVERVADTIAAQVSAVLASRRHGERAKGERVQGER